MEMVIKDEIEMEIVGVIEIDCSPPIHFILHERNFTHLQENFPQVRRVLGIEVSIFPDLDFAVVMVTITETEEPFMVFPISHYVWKPKV